MRVLSKIRQLINPPYSGRDLLVILGVLTLLVSIPLTVSLSTQRPSIAPRAAESTVILRPNGVGAFANWTKVGCSVNWQCVDEATADYNTSYVRSVTGGGDLYNIEDIN